MGIKVQIQTIGGNFKTKQLQFINNLSDKHVRQVAIDTQIVIRQKIKESLQRPGSTGNLEESFFAESAGVRSWGVGRISYLNEQAPYWRWINDGRAGTGRTIPPRTRGHFSPGPAIPTASAFRSGRFQQGSDPNFLLTPGKAIEPHLYIEKTIAEIPRIIQNVFRKVR